MTKFGKLILFLVIIALLVGVVLILQKRLVENIPNSAVTTMPSNTEPEILGNKDDLVSFSIAPGSKVSGVQAVTGKIQNGYFFEANLILNILDSNKNLLRRGNGQTTADWMTAGPVDFKGNLDFTGLPAGPAYIEIHNDNPSGLPENEKHILIPVIIIL